LPPGGDKSCRQSGRSSIFRAEGSVSRRRCTAGFHSDLCRLGVVCHEDRRSKRRCATVREMKEQEARKLPGTRAGGRPAIDVGAVYEWLEAARLERSIQTIRKRYVLARIRDEALAFTLAALVAEREESLLLWEARRFQEADAALRSIREAPAGFMVYEFTLAGKWLEFLRQAAPRVNARGGPSGSCQCQRGPTLALRGLLCWGQRSQSARMFVATQANVALPHRGDAGWPRRRRGQRRRAPARASGRRPRACLRAR
jgi:hypothetical protein